MSTPSVLLPSEVLNIIKTKNSIKLEDLLKEIRKSDPEVQEKDVARILMRLELSGTISVVRLAKKNLLIEYLRKDQTTT